MSRLNFVSSFFIIGILFISFFLIISTFGYIFLFLLNKKREECVIRNPKLFLERFIISFGIGVAIYISYSYILNIFDLFNFFIAYGIILLFDISFLVFYLWRYRTIIFSKETKLYFKKFFLNKITLISIMIISLSYFVAFILYWNIITESIGLIRRDPYGYYENLYFTLQNGRLKDFRLGYGYPSGYIFITSGFLLVSPDPLIVYLFLKMAPLYYILLYLIVSFFVLKNIFKENYLIFFSLLLVSISNTLIARSLLNITSSLATIIVLISFLLLIKNYSYFLLGFFIAAIYLIHPLSLLFYLPVIIIYFFIKFFLNIQNKRIMLKGFFSILLMLSVIIILLVPYVINYPDEILNYYYWYEKVITDPIYNNNLSYISIDILKVRFLQLFNFDFIRNLIDPNLLNRWDYITNESINSFFLASVFGIFLSIYKRNKKIIVFSVSVVCVIIYFYLPYFIPNLGFLEVFQYRSLETLALPIIIMATFFINGILNIARLLTKYLVLKSKSYSLILDRYKPYSNIIRVDIIIMLLIFTNFFIVKIERKEPLYYYYYNDDYVEIILYIRENIEPNSLICRPYIERNEIHFILYDMRFYSYNFSEFTSLDEFFLSLWDRHTDYLIVNNSDISDKWRNHISYNQFFRELILNLTEFSLYKVPS